MWPDVPGNELAADAMHDMVNCASFTDYIEPREGMQQVVAAVLPDSPYTSYTASQSASVVTLTGHTASGANANKWVIFADGSKPAKIAATAGANSYVVYGGQTVGTTTAYIRDTMWGWFWHRHAGVYLAHYGTKLYQVTTSWVWTEIMPGDTKVTGRVSRFRELGDGAMLFCQGMFKIDLTNYQYWKVNVAPGPNNILPGGYAGTTGYYRRYLYTMTRQTGTAELYTDRNSNTIQQETGSNSLNTTTGYDWAKLYSASAYYTPHQKYSGPAGTTYQALVGGAGTILATLVGPNRYFDITIGTTKYTVKYSVGAAATEQEVADAIQTVLKTISPTFTVYQQGGTFTFYDYSPGTTIGFAMTPAVESGFTDVSVALACDIAQASQVNYQYYTQTQALCVTPWTEWKGLTHYSMYTTKTILDDPTPVGDVNAFAWNVDYPMMRGMKGTATTINQVTVNTGYGKFLLSADKGQWLTVIYYDAGVSAWRGTQCQIMTMTDALNVSVDYNMPTTGVYYVFVGSTLGCLYDVTNGVVAVTEWFETNHSAARAWYPDLTVQTPVVGDPFFCDDGKVRHVTQVTSGISFTLDDATYTETNACAATSPKTDVDTSNPWRNTFSDAVSDDTLSTRIGSQGLRSRFFEKMPDCSIGLVVPGFVVTAATNVAYWNNIGVDQQYIIGNCHMRYQSEDLNGTITALSMNQNMLTFYTGGSTYNAQTNLDIKATDPGTGTVVYSLPHPVLVDMYNGTLSQWHVYDYERDLSAVVNQDYGIRTWNGYQYSDNLIFRKIQNKVKALLSFQVAYDEKYGIVILGRATATGSAAPVNWYDMPNDTVYVLGIRQDKYLGASELQNLSLPEPSAPPVIPTGRMVFYSLGVVAGRFSDGKATTWLPNSCIDVPDSTVPATGVAIAWYFETGDDVATDQANTLRHLESHLFVSGRGTNQEVPSACTIDCSIYNDIGKYVTITRTLPSFPLYNPDINFDRRIEGHRVRLKFSFSMAWLVCNGISTFYVSYDKATAISDRTADELNNGNLLAAPALCLTRTELPVSGVSGLPLVETGSWARLDGPDSRTGSAWYLDSTTRLVDASSWDRTGTSGAWQASFWLVPNSTTQIVHTSGLSATYAAGKVTIGTAFVDCTAGTAWTHMLVQKVLAGPTNLLYAWQDGTPASISGSMANADAWTGDATYGPTAKLHDVRVFDGVNVGTPAWSWYRNDMTATGGERCLPA